MASKKKKTSRRVRRPKAPATCFFCDNKRDPNYKDHKSLLNFLSERGRILNKDYTGICSNHQRKLSKAIKNARNLGLLPSSPVI